MERLIFFDTETTGMPHSDGHRLVEMGAIEAINRQRTPKHFHTYLNPERRCDVGAFNVHQLSDDFLAQQPKFVERIDDFLAFIGDATLVIHNADFDMGFLHAELAKLKRPKLKNPIIDSLKIARGSVQGAGGYSLDKLCDFFGVDRSQRVAHGALLDAELLAEVYFRMTRQQAGLDIQSFDHLQYDKRLQAFKDEEGKLPLKVLTPTAEASEAHQAMLANIHAPHFWQ